MASLCFRCVSDGSAPGGQLFYAADGSLRQTGTVVEKTVAAQQQAAGKGGEAVDRTRFASLDVKPAEVMDPKYAKFPYLS